MSVISNNLKALRKRLGLTQCEFGERLLVGQSHISDIESGKENPSKTLVKLASYEFNTSLNLLMGLEEPTPIFKADVDNDLLEEFEGDINLLTSKLINKRCKRFNSIYEGYAYLLHNIQWLGETHLNMADALKIIWDLIKVEGFNDNEMTEALEKIDMQIYGIDLEVFMIKECFREIEKLIKVEKKIRMEWDFNG